MTQNRKTRCLFSTKCIALTTLGLIGMMAAAIFQGALSAAGHVLVEKSEIIQSEIKVIQHQIEGWILQWTATEKTTASRLRTPHVNADQQTEPSPVHPD